MAHRKAGGSTHSDHDSESKRLDVKLFGGRAVKASNILVCQRGVKFHVGYDVGLGKDHALFAKADGVVRFETEGAFGRKYVSIVAA